MPIISAKRDLMACAQTGKYTHLNYDREMGTCFFCYLVYILIKFLMMKQEFNYQFIQMISVN